MPSFKLSAAVVAITIISAQAQYSIDPSTVPISTRSTLHIVHLKRRIYWRFTASWCQSQLASCPLLCLQNPGSADSTTEANDCDPVSILQLSLVIFWSLTLNRLPSHTTASAEMDWHPVLPITPKRSHTSNARNTGTSASQLATVIRLARVPADQTIHAELRTPRESTLPAHHLWHLPQRFPRVPLLARLELSTLDSEEEL